MARRPHKSDAAYNKRTQGALDRLREVAKMRGQQVRDFIPSRSETATTAAAPTTEAGGATEHARAQTPPTSTPPVTPTPEQPAWERGPLPPWAKRSSFESKPSSTTGLQMNLAQRVVLLAGFLVILTMALFPPWIYVFSPSAELRDSYVRVERPAGYHFMFADHSPKNKTQLLAVFDFDPSPVERGFISLHLFSVRLDSNRLAVQIALVTLLTAILYFAFRGKPTPPTH